HRAHVRVRGVRQPGHGSGRLRHLGEHQAAAPHHRAEARADRQADQGAAGEVEPAGRQGGRRQSHDVNKVRAEMEEAGDVETVSTSIDTKGRKQPAKKKAKTSKVMVTEANGKTRPATEAEVSILGDAVKRVGELGIPTQCNVEAALANPIIKAWR